MKVTQMGEFEAVIPEITGSAFFNWLQSICRRTRGSIEVWISSMVENRYLRQLRTPLIVSTAHFCNHS
ncbi:MAG: hypothetical protein ACE5R6_19545 [Candidatus Heimdallarchaeota archaeon]